MIQLSGITKRFGTLAVLQGIDLDVRPGRVTAIVGPNGAGKTTLIKIVLGLARADAGTVHVNGQPVSRDGAYRAAIGYMPQIARFPENLTGAELLEMVRDLRGGAATIDDELIAAFHLDAELRKPLRTLSGGTRQKVNAALAFLFDPALLILDEPTAGLDPVSSTVIKDKILAVRGAGKTLILTSHIMSELEELADDIVFLIDGRLRFAGAVHELKAQTRQRSLERALAHLMMRGAA